MEYTPIEQQTLAMMRRTYSTISRVCKADPIINGGIQGYTWKHYIQRC